ncbi:MAG: hypothetical protein Q9227_003222 [Pyrenula ochraceoflavens]
MDDDAIQMVMSITNTTSALAQQYLTLADGDAEQAVTLFFENGGADLAAGSAVPAAPPAQEPTRSTTSRSAGREDEHGRILIDDDEDLEEGADSRRQPSEAMQAPFSAHTGASIDADAAMAARLQEEMYSGGGDPGNLDEDQVRAPIARQSQTLVGPGSDDFYDDRLEESNIPEAVQRQMRAMQGRRAARPGIFNQRNVSNSIWDESDPASQRASLAQSTGGASQASSKATMLAELFRPPFELMYRGSLDLAREEGRRDSKWIIIDIQDPSVFDCQALNRDIWKDAGIAETVKENFLFLQFNKNDPRASQYLQYYFQSHEIDSEYPHIAILDPRTGEQVKVWSGIPSPKAADFLMQLHEFLDRYSLQAHARNPVAKRKPEPKEKSVSQMTEEEMMEMALKESLAGKANGARMEDPDDLTRSVGDLDKGKAKLVDISNEDTDTMSVTGPSESKTLSESSPFSKIRSDQPHDEPALGPDVTRIAFRHPTGRVIRRFALQDPVQRMYEWLKASPLEGKEGVDFELVTSGKNLIDSLSETIEEAGLKYATVMIEYTGE